MLLDLFGGNLENLDSSPQLKLMKGLLPFEAINSLLLICWKCSLSQTFRTLFHLNKFYASL